MTNPQETDHAPTLDEILTGKWMDAAACRPHSPQRQANPQLTWHPAQGQGRNDLTREAIRICNEECPVLGQCRTYSIAYGFRNAGIWGGMTAKTRGAVRAEMEAANQAINVRQCQLPGCTRRFIVTRLASSEKYCSPLHRSMAKRQRRGAIARQRERQTGS
jgi:hypothetical protein